MQFTKDLQIIRWKDSVLINSQRNANFTINDGEDFKTENTSLCRKQILLHTDGGKIPR